MILNCMAIRCPSGQFVLVIMQKKNTCAMNSKILWHLLNGDSGRGSNKQNDSICRLQKINLNNSTNSLYFRTDADVARNSHV